MKRKKRKEVYRMEKTEQKIERLTRRLEELEVRLEEVPQHKKAWVRILIEVLRAVLVALGVMTING